MTTLSGGLRHAAYAAGWKKFEPLWDLVIRAKRTALMLPVLETVLSEFGRRTSARAVQGSSPTKSSTMAGGWTEKSLKRIHRGVTRT